MLPGIFKREPVRLPSCPSVSLFVNFGVSAYLDQLWSHMFSTSVAILVHILIQNFDSYIEAVLTQRCPIVLAILSMIEELGFFLFSSFEKNEIFNSNNCPIFSRVHATLHFAVLVGPSVRPSRF